MFSNAKEVLKYVKENDVEFVDVRFMDLPGVMQHFNVPAGSFDEAVFEEGLMFDGSSIRGFQAIHESDMKLMPDPATAFLDPFREAKTLVMNFSIRDPFTNEPYSRDPRNVAANAEAYLKSTGIADTVYFGPEAEFYVFDDVRFETRQNASYYYIDSVEAAWNTGRVEEGGNLGYKTPYKGGYFPVPPVDHFADIRDDMVRVLQEVGLKVERSHHEVGTAGQAEINYKFNSLLHAADELMLFKYVIKNVAWQHNKSATFMPKPLFGDNGSGMHCHQSLWKNEKPLFAGDGYGGLSEMAMFYIGGVLKHARALAAITNPTLNSYRRIVPGFEAPVNLAYSARNRSASIRIPVGQASPKAKRIEIRFPDPTANPYLAFAALMMAGLDGIEKKIHPGDPLDKDIYSLSPEELAEVPTVPGSLDASLDALHADRSFLMKGDVFSNDLIDAWIAYKRENEADHVRLRPVPAEFQLYYDC